jgi:cytochrome P450
MASYYNKLADERAAHPAEDLLTDLTRSEAAGDIDRTGLLSLVAVLLLAGHETTTGAIGNAVVALGRNPDQRELLRARPDLWPNAVEELLRYDTVLQTDPRQALEDITIAGRTIRAGQNLTIMLGAVNRDPARFAEPNRLRVDRHDPAPLSFGHGIHYCVGAALARLELRLALPAILDAVGDYEIDEAHLEWKRSLAFRSPTRLPIRVQAGRPNGHHRTNSSS